MNNAAIYAGSFDPMTLGHLDVAKRAARVFPRVIIGVAQASQKATLFDVHERTEIVREAVQSLRHVEVEPFDGLLVEYARRKGIHVIIRGIRAFSDFEFEFQMALTNRKMAPDIETLFLMPKEEFSYISSSTVRAIAELGGNVATFAPESAVRALKRKLCTPPVTPTTRPLPHTEPFGRAP